MLLGLAIAVLAFTVTAGITTASLRWPMFGVGLAIAAWAASVVWAAVTVLNA